MSKRSYVTVYWKSPENGPPAVFENITNIEVGEEGFLILDQKNGNSSIVSMYHILYATHVEEK